MLKLLVVDMSPEITSALQKVLGKEFELRVCHDGETALELLQDFKPDALVLNLWIPYKDGLTVLQESAHRPRVILAMSPVLPPYAQQRAMALGIHYVMIMPRIETIRVRLMDMVADMQPRGETRIAVRLHSLGFRPNLDGYRQLCAGIPIFAENPNMLLSKELYPAVAEVFGLADCRTVEHSVRKAIADAWSNRDPVVWEKYFPGAKKAPTNKVFISRLAEMSKN